MQYLLPALSAFVLTLMGIVIALHVFPKLGLLDRPKKYKLNRKPIPYPGGILIYLVFTALALIFFDPTFKLLGLLLGGGILVIVSFIDDRISLPPWLRLIVQFLVALIMVWVGIGVTHITNPFGGEIRLDQFLVTLQVGNFSHVFLVLSAIFTVIWIMLLTNTMNWLDGIPGLVSGISVIGGLTLFFLSISPLVNQPEIATLSVIVACMALAFWLFDFYPPKLLLGDSGAMFFGLLLAVLAIFSGGKIATAFLVLGFPVVDVIYVIGRRLANKQAPWKGGEWDKKRKAVHLHHRLLQFGFSEQQTLILIYALAIVFGGIALLVGTQGKFRAIVAIAVLSFILGIFLKPKRKGTIKKTKL
ncbi:MAG: MraY family glycosyltransferase [Candidatus Peregrinibacteria bacterium]